MSNSATPWTAARQASLSSTISRSLLRFLSIELVMLSNHLILCCSFSFCLQSFPASGSFSMNQFFMSGGQSSGASASASVLPMNIQGSFPLGLTDFISLLSKGISRVFSSTTIWKHQFLGLLYSPILRSIHDYWKKHNFDYINFCQQSDIPAMQVCHNFPSKEQASFDFMAVVIHCPQWFWSLRT